MGYEEINRDKNIEKIERLKREIPEGDSVWLMYSSEGSDPYFRKFITKKTIVPAASLVNRENIILFVHSLDADNLQNFYGTKIIYGTNSSLTEEIKKSLQNINFPQNIYLNYSKSADAVTDVLGHGSYTFLNKIITEFYEEKGKKVCFCSADSIIYPLLERKTEEDIKYMKLAANRGLQIIEDVFKEIKVGMTERDIFNLFHEKFKQKPKYFKEYGIVNEEYSWEKEGCPIVLVGPNLTKGGHALPSDKILKPGYTVYCDFGVKLCLEDGKKYASDLQRMGYALKNGEKHAPEKVQKVFDTLTEAISLGIQNCTPEKKGYEIDSIVRNYIVNKGYPNYNHSTGHPVGETAHSPGTSIAPENSKRSDLFLQENGVYTIEPRIQIENGGSIEEMVIASKNGGETLCKRQESLYLI